MQQPGPKFVKQHPFKHIEFYKFEGSKTGYTNSHLARLSGAPEGTKFTFAMTHGGFFIRGSHEEFFEPGKPMERLLLNTHETGLTLYNVQFHLKPEYCRNGAGFQMLRNQIEACQELQVPTIACLAGRWGKDDDGKRVPLDGYVVWPKLGFDGPIPEAVLGKLSPEFARLQNVQALIATPEGLAEWIAHGDSCRLTFDVRPGSMNLKNFIDYGTRKNFLP